MRFPGIIPAVTTPVRPRPARSTTTRSSATSRALLDAGVHGFVATGTMGEAGSLTHGRAPHGRRGDGRAPPTAASP